MEHREQHQPKPPNRDYSVVPSVDQVQPVSPYPRHDLEAAPQNVVPLRRRLAWDIGLAVFALFAAASINSPDKLTGNHVWWTISLYAVIALGAIFWGQKRGEIKSWQALAIVYFGGMIGSSIYDRSLVASDSAFVSGSPISAFISLFCLLCTIFIGPLSRWLGVSKANITDPYEAVRQSWANTCLFTVFASILAAFTLSLVVQTLGQEIAQLYPAFTTMLTLLLVAIANVRSCRTPQLYLAYLWTPVVLGTPVVAAVAFTGTNLLPTAITGVIIPGIAFTVIHMIGYFLVQRTKQRRQNRPLRP